MNNNYEHEKQLVGFLLANQESVGEALGQLCSNDFNDVCSKKVFETIRVLFVQNTNYDLALVVKKSNIPMSTIQDLKFNNYISFGNFKDHLKLIRQEAIARDFISASRQIKITDTLESKNDQIQKIVQALAVPTTKLEVLSGEEAATKYFENFFKPETKGINTGLTTLDCVTGGLKRGALWTIAARTGIGKTNLSLNFIVEVLKQKKKALFISLEMNSDELMERFIALTGNVLIDELKSKTIDKIKLSKSLEFFCNKNNSLKIMAGSVMTSYEIISLVNYAKLQDGLDVVVVDYMSRLADRTRPGENEEIRLTNIARSLKNLALELDITVISPIQIDKKSAVYENIESIAVEDAKGSTSLGHESDVSLRIVKVNTANAKDHGYKILVTKNRSGAMPILDVYFDPTNLKITEIDHVHKV